MDHFKAGERVAPTGRPSITAVLATTDAEIQTRMAAAWARVPSGLPPVAPFMPDGLLVRIEQAVRSSSGKGSRAATTALIVHDMLYGQSRRPPRADDRSAGQASSAECIGNSIATHLGTPKNPKQGSYREKWAKARYNSGTWLTLLHHP